MTHRHGGLAVIGPGGSALLIRSNHGHIRRRGQRRRQVRGCLGRARQSFDDRLSVDLRLCRKRFDVDAVLCWPKLAPDWALRRTRRRDASDCDRPRFKSLLANRLVA